MFWHESCKVAGMLTRDLQPSASTLLRWEFVRGRDRLVCQMAHEADSHFSVAVMPLGQLGKAAASLFNDATTAVRYHATLASGLRDAGWKVVGYTH
jgi:hypothetical protein